MTGLEALLASYIDLARHADPMRFPGDAPADTAHLLGRFDAASRRDQVAALRSVANAVEDLGVEDLDDEVDRTMLLNTVRADIAAADADLTGGSSNPVRPLMHLNAALLALMGEDFDLSAEAALRARIAAIPGFLDALHADRRPAPDLVVQRAALEADLLAQQTLDLASERLDDATVQPALVAVADHRRWLGESDRAGGETGWGSAPFEARLATMVSEPLGAKGTLRVLELRRAGVERSLSGAATELGNDDPHRCAQRLHQESLLAPEVIAGFWADEWQRVANAMEALGFPVKVVEAPDVATEAQDGWSMAAWAVRGEAASMFETARGANARVVRRRLLAPGLVPGWGRCVAALVRGSDVYGMPERRLMMSHLALREAAAAEADLMIHAGFGSVAELEQRLIQTAGLGSAGARAVMTGILVEPLRALAAALAHEAWQEWYADLGGLPAEFARRALEAGGLSVPLARWAMESQG